MYLSLPRFQLPDGNYYTARLKRYFLFLQQRSDALMHFVKQIGFSISMEEYDQRKLIIFNQLNFFQLITGIIIPFIGLINNKHLPAGAWAVACLPAFVSLLVLYLNKQQRHETALLVYFMLYPFITCIVYLYGMNLGISLSFILYGILAVFFIKDWGWMIFSICFSMISYFLLSVVLKKYIYQLQDFNNGLYLFNQAVALMFIFYGLFLIKKENNGYQFRILKKNAALLKKNEQILKQANQIKEDSLLLQKQANELAELNAVKNKLFSIISHDMKSPLYAVRNLFREAHQNNISAQELKDAVPEVINDLNYTVGLMDNLLQWAKAQMQTTISEPQEVNLSQSIEETLNLIRLQAKHKQIRIKNHTKDYVFGYTNKDMINLVLRNLLTNAIKFTPLKGTVSVGIHEHASFIEVYVRDSGDGIDPDALMKINNNSFYTTNGTASESGTGLGLMLCKEFLARNNSQLHIESNPGKGSVFSFSVPKCA
jgi:two-component system, sensor histidine kinase and response regulator